MPLLPVLDVQAADIVLVDDQFPNIVHAIKEGRTVFDNLKKTVA